MTESQAIPWKRLSAEAAAIVISILLAFWIDAWWDERNDYLEEREILIGLEVEFVDLRERLDYWAGMNRTGVQLIEQFLSESVAEMDLESMQLLFVYASLVNVLDQGGAIDALLASGRLERISDRDIRARLVKWPDWLEDIHTNDLSVRGYAWGEIIPFLAARGIPRRACSLEDLACYEPGPVPPSFLSLAEDSEFRALLITRRLMMLFSIDDHENARSEADAILTLIRVRLGEFGP
jgi:hypothetical protein